MNFIELIPSKYVADFVRQTNYKLTPNDMAYITYKSQISLEEKHKAYLEIINTTSNCIVCEYGKTLHDALKVIIELQKNQLSTLDSADDIDYGVVFLCDHSFDIYSCKEMLDIEITKFKKVSAIFDAIAKLEKAQTNYINKIIITTSQISIELTPSLVITNINVLNNDDFQNAIAILNLDENFPNPYKDGDIVTSLEDTPTFVDTPASYLYVYSSANGGKFWDASSSFAMCYKHFIQYSKNEMLLECSAPLDDIIHKLKDDKKYFNMPSTDIRLISALSALLKNEIDISQFIEVYNYCVARKRLDEQEIFYHDDLRKKFDIPTKKEQNEQ